MLKRRVVIAVVLTSIFSSAMLWAGGPKRYLKKETTVDMSGVKNVFLGWLDLHPGDWGIYGYSTEEEWSLVIKQLNSSFQGLCRSKYLMDKNVIAAKNAADESTTGQDLIVRFSQVSIDYDNLYLVLGIEFIEPKNNQALGTIPVRPYYRRIFWVPWGFERYLYNDLEEVGQKLQVEIAGGKGK